MTTKKFLPVVHQHPSHINATYIIHKCIAVLLVCLFFFQPIHVRQYIYSHIYNWTYSLVDSSKSAESKSFAHHRLLFVLVTTMIHTGVYVIMNTCYTICYKLQHPAIEQYKSNKEQPWPWLSESEKKRNGYYTLLRKSIGLIAFINLIYAPGLAYFTFATNESFFTWRIAELPTTLTTAWQLFVCMVLEDAMFYWLHRMLHSKQLYFIHKQHHEYKNTVGICSEYTSLWEAMLLGVPFIAGPQLLGIHVYTYYLWLALRVFQSVDAHSGYEFPFIPFTLLPYLDTASNHELHHRYSTGNYSSFFDIWDRMCGTVIHQKYKGETES